MRERIGVAAVGLMVLVVLIGAALSAPYWLFLVALALIGVSAWAFG